MPPAIQFPCPNVIPTAQALNGLYFFSVRPVLSTTCCIRIPLLLMTSSYLLFNSPSGVVGTNSTESNPPFLYHVFFSSLPSSSIFPLVQRPYHCRDSLGLNRAKFCLPFSPLPPFPNCCTGYIFNGSICHWMICLYMLRLQYKRLSINIAFIFKNAFAGPTGAFFVVDTHWFSMPWDHSIPLMNFWRKNDRNQWFSPL